MPKASQFRKSKSDKSMYPSGHTAKPSKGFTQPVNVNDNNRVVFSEEPNPNDR